MAKNKISDLRDHMFAALERLSDENLTGEELSAEMERARAISDVGKVIVESAKTEILYHKMTQGTKSKPATGFIDEVDADKFNEHQAIQRPPAEYSNSGHINVTKKYVDEQQ